MRFIASTPRRSLAHLATSLACAGLALAAAACGDDAGTPPDASALDAARLDAGTPDASPPDTLPIDAMGPMLIGEARDLPDGAMVTVEGYVTVAPGNFNSATGEQGFAIQDESQGIYIKMVEKVELALESRVRVTGTLGQLAQLRVIEATPADVTPVAGTQSIKPAAVPTGAVDEDVEGLLIKVFGLITRDVEEDPPYGLKVYIDDGTGEVQVFVHLVDGVGVIDTSDLEVGDNIQVTGLGAQYEATYEVAPRQASDLVLLPPPATPQ